MDFNSINWEGLSRVLPQNKSSLTVESPDPASARHNHLKLTLDRQMLRLEKRSPVQKWEFCFDLATRQLSHPAHTTDDEALSIANHIVSTLIQLNERGKARYSVN